MNRTSGELAMSEMHQSGHSTEIGVYREMTATIGHLYRRQAEDQVSVMMESTCQLDNILEVNSEGLIIESMMICMNEIGVEEEITLVGTGEKGLIAADRDRTM
jgi:hypothetical protein